MTDARPVGAATMDEDGTITLMLFAEDESGAVGSALLRYPIGHPRYDAILAHVRGLEVGEEKLVPPWPEAD